MLTINHHLILGTVHCVLVVPHRNTYIYQEEGVHMKMKKMTGLLFMRMILSTGDVTLARSSAVSAVTVILENKYEKIKSFTK